MSTWVLLAAAGRGLRLDPSGVTPKQFLQLDGLPLFWHSAQTFSRVAGIEGIVFIFPPDGDAESYTQMLDALDSGRKLGLERRVALGGDTRQASVRNGLAALPPLCRQVLVHDSARPFMDAALVVRVLDALAAGHKAVIPGLPVTDTVKVVDAEGKVTATPERAALRAVQTPQGFARDVLQKAHSVTAQSAGSGVTSDHSPSAATGAAPSTVPGNAPDDAALVEALGLDVFVVEGSPANRKITNPEDLALLTGSASAKPGSLKENGMRMCCGLGYDVHRYGGDRPFILGGVPIATDIMVQAHSDGDTLLHALMDALLGCIGGGDIGGMFPDADPRFAGISSGLLLAEVRERCLSVGLELHHVDITIVAQAPRIGPHRDLIAKNIATLLHLPIQAVNIKATTEEGLGFTGEKKGIKVMAQVCGMIPAQGR